MIKLRIHPKNLGEREVKVLRKCQNYRVFYIFLGILHKMKKNLGQRVKRELLSFWDKTGTIAPDFPGKKAFCQFCIYFSACPSLKSGLPTCTKIIFLK